MKPCIFFDRDGTLIEERNYLSDPDQVVLIPGAAEAVRLARGAGYLTVVLTNQSGVGRGYFTLEDVERVNARMLELLLREGAEIDGIYVCPHAPEEGCGCRKPRTGLVERAARELGIDVGASWMVGDKAADLELARNAGMRGVLVQTGYGSEAAAQLSGGETLSAANVLEAVRRIVSGR
ncbi:MAG: D-glycero-alpha-D-manno-heptose-1,7-bisphosphate 7-phosphatase [Bryobacteraceae bacterium]